MEIDSFSFIINIYYLYALFRISLIDLRYMKIYNRDLIILMFYQIIFFQMHLLSSLIFTIPYLAIYILSNIFNKHVMGEGDIKFILVASSIIKISIDKFLLFNLLISIIASILLFSLRKNIIPLAPAIALTLIILGEIK